MENSEQANSFESVTHEFNKQMNEDPYMRAAFEEMMNQQITSQKVTIKRADFKQQQDAGLVDRILNQESFRQGSAIRNTSLTHD